MFCGTGLILTKDPKPRLYLGFCTYFLTSLYFADLAWKYRRSTCFQKIDPPPNHLDHDHSTTTCKDGRKTQMLRLGFLNHRSKLSCAAKAILPSLSHSSAGNKDCKIVVIGLRTPSSLSGVFSGIFSKQLVDKLLRVVWICDGLCT